MNKYAILPCNGLDKCAGSMTKEIAMLLAEESGSEIICPVFYRTADAKYTRLAQEMPLLVIDGCATRCAAKLAAEKNLKIAEKVIVTDEAKAAGVELPKSLRLGEPEKKLARGIADRLLMVPETAPEVQSGEQVAFPAQLDYEIYKKDKFVFRVPKNQGFYFNENDVWVYISGSRARIGITDFVQKSLSDIMYFTPPSIGMEVEQFDSAGEVESGKAVFEVISPVSGTVVAINDKLSKQPELMNDNPYEIGWIAELELSDFDSDKEMLHEFEAYFPILKRKVDEFRV